MGFMVNTIDMKVIDKLEKLASIPRENNDRINDILIDYKAIIYLENNVPNVIAKEMYFRQYEKMKKG